MSSGPMFDPLRIAGAAPYVVAAAVAAPIGFVLANLAEPVGALHHVWTTTGPHYLAGTLFLCASVAVCASAFGAGAAALIALADFPGRRILSIGLALPLAMPAYVSAYAYGDLFGPFGGLAMLFGAGQVPPIRSGAGAALVLAFAVAPYVYLAMRASLASRSAAYFEAARTLGASPVAAFRRVLLPVGRAAFAGGLALALMETIADYGVAEYFGVPTLGVGVVRTWRGLGDLVAASQLASGLFLLALLLVLLEAAARRGSGAESARAQRGAMRFRLSAWSSLAAIAFCAIPVVFGFAAPALILVAKLLQGSGGAVALIEAALNTALASGLGCAVVLALALALAANPPRNPWARAALTVATLGYALPGVVIAVGVLGAAAALGEGLEFVPAAFPALIYAYVTRFLTAAHNSIEGGLAQIHPLTEDAARTLGASPLVAAARVRWLLARPAIAAGALIVLIDIARELPATLILRPFDFETLATRVYRLASDERLAEAAPAALALVALSLIPAILLERVAKRD